VNRESWQEMLFTLKQNPLRTALTAFGVFWGILMLILLLGAGTGLERGARGQMSSDLDDAVWINARRTSLPWKGLSARRDITLTIDDIAALKSKVDGVQYVTGETALGSFRRADTYVAYKNRSGSFGVFGVAHDYFKIKVKQDYVAGRRLNELDIDEQRKVVVIRTLLYD